MARDDAARQLRAQWKAQAAMKGLKAPEGAKAAGVSVRQFHRWLSGEAQLNDLEAFAHKLNMTFTVTIGPDAEKPSQSFDWDDLMDTLDSVAVRVEALTVDEARDRKAKRLVAKPPATTRAPRVRGGGARSAGRNQRTQAGS